MPAGARTSIATAMASGGLALGITLGGLGVAVPVYRIVVPVGWALAAHAAVVLRGLPGVGAAPRAVAAAAGAAVAGLASAAVVARGDASWAGAAAWISGVAGLVALGVAVSVVVAALVGWRLLKLAGLWRRSLLSVVAAGVLLVVFSRLGLPAVGAVLLVLAEAQLALAGRATARWASRSD